jgi:hypothetical protein
VHHRTMTEDVAVVTEYLGAIKAARTTGSDEEG